MAERHPFDPVSLLAGLLALTGAGLFLLDDAGLVQVDAVLTAATLLVVLGAFSLVRSLLGLRREER